MVLCSRCSDITSAANPLNATKLPSAAHPSTPPLKAIKLTSAAHPSTQPLKATKLPSAAHPPSSTPPLKVTKSPSVAYPWIIRKLFFICHTTFCITVSTWHCPLTPFNSSCLYTIICTKLYFWWLHNLHVLFHGIRQNFVIIECIG